jgi:hypothetical protein
MNHGKFFSGRILQEQTIRPTNPRSVKLQADDSQAISDAIVGCEGKLAGFTGGGDYTPLTVICITFAVFNLISAPSSVQWVT